MTRRHGRRSVWWHNGVEATSSEYHRVAVLCADTGAVARCQPPCRQERQGVVAWHWDSPVTTCKEDLGVIWVTVISNGHFNMPLGFTDHTVDHNSYRYWGLL